MREELKNAIKLYKEAREKAEKNMIYISNLAQFLRDRGIGVTMLFQPRDTFKELDETLASLGI